MPSSPLPGPPILWRFPLLDAARCGALRARMDTMPAAVAPITTARGFEMRPDIRNNERVMFDDPDLAAELFADMAAHLPPQWEAWRLVGLNERFRGYLYRPGMYFAPHGDGAFVRHDFERSLFTVMLYLNDDFEGGETRFYRPDAVARPVAGDVLCFWHPLPHEGRVVTRGVKYVLRTDAMYRR
jgi:prolyl 4-hydroxylase